MLSRITFIVFLLVPIVNFGISYFDPSGARFEQDPQVIFEPAGYAFSIWSFIFIGMIIWSYQVMKKMDLSASLERSAMWAAMSAGLASITFAPLSLQSNQVWVWLNILWHLVSLILLFKSNQKLRDKYIEVIPAWHYIGPQMYLGWICAAFVVSTSLLLRYLGVSFDDGIEQIISIALIIILGGLGYLFTKQRGSTVALVLVWALIGLMVARIAMSEIVIACILVSIFILSLVYNQKRLENELI